MKEPPPGSGLLRAAGDSRSSPGASPTAQHCACLRLCHRTKARPYTLAVRLCETQHEPCANA